MLPGPTNVPPRVMQAMIKPVINHRGPEFKELYARLIQNAKLVFGTEHHMAILSASGTGGVEAALTNVMRPGDEIIVPVMGTFSSRVRDMVKTFGGNPVEITIDLGKNVTVDQVEDALKKTKRTKAVVVVYNETSTGATARCLKEIGDICARTDTLFVVDAISILGGDELPVDDWSVDVCIAGSQKCLMTPPGLALVSINDRALKVMENSKRAYYFDLVANIKQQEEGQTPYTPALPLYYALDEALQMILQEGMEARIHRHKICAEAFYNGFGALKLEPFAAKEFRSNTVISINCPPRLEASKFRALLREKYGVVIAGGMGPIKEKILRVGNMGTIGPEEVLTTINAFGNALRAMDYDANTAAGVMEATRRLEAVS